MSTTTLTSDTSSGISMTTPQPSPTMTEESKATEDAAPSTDPPAASGAGEKPGTAPNGMKKVSTILK